MALVTIVDPSVATTNLGDKVIAQAIDAQITSFLTRQNHEVVKVPMHGWLEEKDVMALDSSAAILVTGTNLLSNHMAFRSQLRWLRRYNKSLRRKTVFVGVGWWQYQTGSIDRLTARLLDALSLPAVAHLPRDVYSANKLTSAGLQAVSGSCPTLWSATSQRLPGSSSSAIVTFSDYNQDPVADKHLLSIVQEKFSAVRFWAQGPGDRAYCLALGLKESSEVGSGLADFDGAVSSPGTCHVGLRLHAGIRAVQLGSPSLVIAIDNRAREIARDTGFAVCSRYDPGDLRAKLATTTDLPLAIPLQIISEWKASLVAALA